MKFGTFNLLRRSPFICRLARHWFVTLIVVFLVLAVFYLSVTPYHTWMPRMRDSPPLRPLLLEPPPRPDLKHVRPKIIYDHSHYISSEQADFYVGNCLVTNKFELSHVADAVAITWRKHDFPSRGLPPRRFSWQRWVWIMDESPFHAGEDLTLADGLFNWTMTYRKDSDVYIPYGAYERRDKRMPVHNFNGSRQKLVAAVISNNNLKYVHNGRLDFVTQLKKHIPVSIYGRIGQPCDGYSHDNYQQSEPCPLLKEYYFYLALENSNCKEYITEKVFANAFSTGTVPVVLGGSRAEYETLLPPNSFIYVRDFSSVIKLAEYLLFLSNNTSEYMKFHKWREQYKTSYRIQYHVLSVWKPLCDALNNDDGSVSVRNISQWWVVNDCEKHTDTYVNS